LQLREQPTREDADFFVVVLECALGDDDARHRTPAENVS
jgi:hypothetical protein